MITFARAGARHHTGHKSHEEYAEVASGYTQHQAARALRRSMVRVPKASSGFGIRRAAMRSQHGP